MEKSSKIKNARGITTVGKNPNLVSWDLGYRLDESGVVRFDVSITFSSKARAKTGRGDKQDSHASAYALNLAQTMKIVKYTVPQEENDFIGLNNLVNEMALIPQRDYFLLKKFDLMSQNVPLPKEFKIDLHSLVKEQQDMTNEAINALNQAINSAQRYQRSPTSLVADDNTNTGKEILTSLNKTNITSLENLKLGARRDYSLNVATKAAEKLLSYQNTAPYVTFPEIPTNDEDEKAFRKAEGSRVRKALGILMAYSSSDLSVVQDFADEEDQLDEEETLTLDEEETLETKNLSASTSIADQQPTLRQQPKRGKQMHSNLNLGKLTKENVIYPNKSLAEKEKEEKNKKKLQTKIIVQSIYDLLYYPPLDKDDLKKISMANQQNARTNDINVFCYVLTRHLATILETFNKLIDLEDKDEIINGFLDKMIADWSEIINEAQIGQLNKHATFDDKKKYMKDEVKSALGAWQQVRDIIPEDQKMHLTLSSESYDSNSAATARAVIDFSLLPSPIVSSSKKTGEQSMVSPQQMSPGIAISHSPDTPHTELQPRYLDSSLQTPSSRTTIGWLGPEATKAAQASAAKRRESVISKEANENGTGSSNKTTPDKKGPFRS